MERVIWIGLRGEQNGPVLIWDAACKKLDPNFQSKSVNPTEWLRVEQVEAALSGIGLKCMNQWKRDLEPVKQAVREALKDDYEDGRNIIIEAILATSVK
jgi:hypothetical protein